MNQISKILPNVLSETESKSLSDYFTEFPGIYYGKGIFMSRSDLIKYLLFIEEGKVCIMNDEYQNTLFSEQYIYEGMFANLETAFCRESYKNCFLKIKAPTLIKKIPLSIFNNLLETSISFNQIINQLLAKQARNNQRKVNRLRFTSSKYRILYYLLELANKKGRAVGYEKVIDNPPTQFEIAALSNTARQTVTTLLSRLREHKIIHYNRRYIIFRDLERIKEMMILEQ